MTVLARNDAAGMVPELILSAGIALIGSDFGNSLWGVSSWGPIHFQGEGGSTISADRREGLWVVGSCAACIEWPASAALPPQEPPFSPSPPPVPESFETFRAAIGR